MPTRRSACWPRAPARWRSRIFACSCSPSRAPPRGANPAARAALEELLRATPDSPLRRASLLKLAELAFAEAKIADALAFLAQGREPGRGERLSAVEREQFDSLAWTIGRATGDEAVQREAARRLLVGSPLAAARLDVAGAMVTRPQGDWREFLSPAELLERASALLQAEVPQGALVTLDAVPEAARSFEWSLLRARALTAAQRGNEALNELSLAGAVLATGGAGATSGDRQATLELERAHALADATAVRRGRPALPAAERARLRADELGALRRAVALSTSPDLKAAALRELLGELEATGEIDSTIALLHELAKVAPGDALGARPLWERGWREYQAGNWSGAIGYWSELRDLYPTISYARSAFYWSGRAFEKLGDRERSRAAFVELTRADTADFYSRQAVVRLAGTPSTAGPERDAQREEWPTDRAIDRARWLSDLALDKLATAELDRVAPAADSRAAAALRGLILARTGVRRESLRELRKAFPQLATAHQETVPRAALELYYPRPFADQVAPLRGREIAAAVAGLRHRAPGERIRSGGQEPLRGARPDADHAFDRQGGRAPARDALLDAAAVRARVQFAPRYDILPPDAGDLRQPRGARAGRIQRRAGAHRATLARTAVCRRSRPLPRRTLDRRVAQLRETHSRLGRKLPEPVFRSQLTREGPIVGLRYTGFAACWAEFLPGP